MSTDRAATLRQAEDLVRQGKLDQAVTEYRRLVKAQPHDWNTTNLLGDLYVRAGRPDLAVEQFCAAASRLGAEGFYARASAVYKKILKLQPDADHALMQSGEMAAQQGLLADARTLFARAAEGRRQRGDANGAWEVVVRSGRLDADDVSARLAAAHARVQLDDVTGALRELHDLASRLIEHERDVQALAPLREIARLDPANVRAARELVRILTDQGLDAEAAVYLRADAGGAAAAAVDAGADLRAEPPGHATAVDAFAETSSPSTAALVANGHASSEEHKRAADEGMPAVTPTEMRDLPLGGAMDDTLADQPTSSTLLAENDDIEAVFARLRDGSAQHSGDDAADAAFTRGAAYFEAGEFGHSSEQLRVAARSPRRRFAAASLLAGICQQEGRTADAIEWLGHAADAPGLADALRFDTLMRLATLLEAAGESASALAVCLELQADAGDFRDLTARIARLSRAQAGG